MKKKRNNLAKLVVQDEGEQERINKMIQKRKSKLNRLMNKSKKLDQQDIQQQRDMKRESHRAKIQAQLNIKHNANLDPQVDQIDEYYQDKMEGYENEIQQAKLSSFPQSKRLYADFDIDQKYHGESVSKDQVFNNKMSTQLSDQDQQDSIIEEQTEQSQIQEDNEQSNSQASQQYLNLIKNKHFMEQDGQSLSDDQLNAQIDDEIQNLQKEYHESLQKMKTVSSEQLRKAQCINQQINFHQSLMKFRLTSLQKLHRKCNQLPPNQTFKKLSKISQSSETLQQPILNNLYSVLCDLILLQQDLWEYRGKLLNLQKLPSCLNFQQDQNIWNIIDYQNNSIQPACNEIIERWNRKNQLSNRKGSQLNQLNKSIPAQVQYLIQTNRDKIIKKTQLLQQQQSQLKVNYKDFLDPTQVYNDSQFYLSQLKQWGSNMNQQGLSQAQLSMQLKSAKRRAQIKAKDVDTKASKGRKLRYHVHQKLVGFMYPKDVINGSNQYEEEINQNNQILSTLFGEKTGERNVTKKYNKEELKEISKQQKIWEDAQIRFI